MQIYRGHVLILGEYQINFIECVENNRIFMSADTSKNSDIFNSGDEIYLVFSEKKSKFSFYFTLFIGYT